MSAVQLIAPSATVADGLPALIAGAGGGSDGKLCCTKRLTLAGATG